MDNFVGNVSTVEKGCNTRYRERVLHCFLETSYVNFPSELKRPMTQSFGRRFRSPESERVQDSSL